MNFEGGHLETKGLSAAGQVVTVPQHRHQVSLDFQRIELGLARQLSEGWTARLRMPYDIKQRRARLELVEPATDEEVASMQRNLDIHHPSETLRGVADPHLLLTHHVAALLGEGDHFVVSLGTSIPLGRIEENPYLLGGAGQAHEHIQFGSGTFDPLAEALYTTPLADGLELTLSATGRFPITENRKGYEAPIEITAEVGLGLDLNERLSVHSGWSLLYQDFAHWDGVRDINSGVVTHGVTAGLVYTLESDVSVLAAVRLPVSQRTLDSGGDTFEMGPIFQLGFTCGF